MTDTQIAERIEKLERENRRFKRLGVAALLMAAALGAISATMPVPQKITAREFDVVDNAGKVQVKIGLDCPDSALPHDCWPAITLFGEHEHSLWTDSGLEFRGHSLKPSSPPGLGSGEKYGPQGDVLARLGIGSGNDGELSLFGKSPSITMVRGLTVIWKAPASRSRSRQPRPN